MLSSSNCLVRAATLYGRRRSRRNWLASWSRAPIPQRRVTLPCRSVSAGEPRITCRPLPVRVLRVPAVLRTCGLCDARTCRCHSVNPRGSLTSPEGRAAAPEGRGRGGPTPRSAGGGPDLVEQAALVGPHLRQVAQEALGPLLRNVSSAVTQPTCRDRGLSRLPHVFWRRRPAWPDPLGTGSASRRHCGNAAERPEPSSRAALARLRRLCPPPRECRQRWCRRRPGSASSTCSTLLPARSSWWSSRQEFLPLRPRVVCSAPNIASTPHSPTATATGTGHRLQPEVVRP